MAILKRIFRSRRDLRSKLGIFGDLFDLVGFKVFDIGARGGPLDWTTFFAPFAGYFACEPDASARMQLKKAVEAAHPWANVTIVPEALASKSGVVTLHVTQHEGMSSLLKPNVAIARTFGLANEFTVERQIDVPAITLDEAARNYGFEDLALIKVDTQGTELSILESGKKLIAESVQGIFVEVEFREFYHGQPLFSEVELFLRQYGFELISLEPVTSRRTSTELRIGYSRREIIWAHAMFIKRAADAAMVGEEKMFRHITQQLAIGMAREQFDLAAERLVNPQYQAQLRSRNLTIGLGELEACIRRLYSGWSYRMLCASWPQVAKHRNRYRFR
jgi:FkbM family methyltransferase